MDGCPRFAPAYLGRKWFFRMLLASCATALIRREGLLHRLQKAIVGLRPVVLNPGIRISCTGLPQTYTCAAFIKESRMRLVNANGLNRKIGVRWGESGAPVMHVEFVGPTRSGAHPYLVEGQKFRRNTAGRIANAVPVTAPPHPGSRYCRTLNQ
jgi:hypothetical protein